MSAKQLVKKLLLSPLGTPIRGIYSGFASVLVYHRVTNEAICPNEFHPESGLAVQTSEFRQQMELLSTKYQCVSLRTLFDMLTGAAPTSKKPVVAVTFDDGYRDNLECALPILEEFSIPATIFVTTGFIDGIHEPWWFQTGALVAKLDQVQYAWDGDIQTLRCGTVDEKRSVFLTLDQKLKSLPLAQQGMLLDALFQENGIRPSFSDQFLTWDEVRMLHGHPLVSLGAHTISHAPLAACSNEELEKEIFDGKSILESKLKSSVHFFAYPYGKKDQCSLREFAAAETAGLLASFTTRSGHIQKAHRGALHALPRLAIDHFMSIQDFEELVLSGLSTLVKRKGQLFVTD